MIQYNHKRNLEVFLGHDGYTLDGRVSPTGGETIALEIPEVWFLEALKPGEFFDRRVGKARCSDDDNYIKKAGRELAESRMKPRRLTCIGNQQFKTERLVVLQDAQENLYTLRVRENCKNAHFIDYE